MASVRVPARTVLATIAAVAPLLGCASGRLPANAPIGDLGRAGLESIRADALVAHTKFLSSDALEGRGPGTRGHEAAVQYAIKELRALGLAPGGDNGTYEQSVPLRGMARDDAACSLRFTGEGGSEDFRGNEDAHFVPFASKEAVRVEAPVAFVGFGIAAPDLGYDDVSPVDVRGKIAVLLHGVPTKSGKFGDVERAVYSDVVSKVKHLESRGAVAVLLVSTPEREHHYPWKEQVANGRFERMTWLEGNAPGSGSSLPTAWITMASLDRMLARGGARTSAAALVEATSSAKPPVVSLAGKATLAIASKFRDLRASNVVAVLPGSDPTLAKEHVVFSAHIDHLGVGPAVDGDSIYNGALDDAVGVAAVIEIARAFTRLPAAPQRSIAFLLATAEEKGLLGSDYFAAHPTLTGPIIADVNTDGPIPFYEMFDAVPLGAEHSSLMRNAEEAAAAMGVTISPDPTPEELYFIRSDQFSFVRRGVPSVFPTAGFKDRSGDTKRNRELSDKWFAAHYHKPSDVWRDEYSGEAMAKEVRFDFLLGLSIARQPARPRWNPGDFFLRHTW